jgi:hypothetical protein
MIIISSFPPPDWLTTPSSGLLVWAHESSGLELAETEDDLWLIEPKKLEYLSILNRRNRLGLITYYSGQNSKFKEISKVLEAPNSMKEVGDLNRSIGSGELRILRPDIDPLTDIILGSYTDKEKEELIDLYLEKYPDSADAAVVISELNPSRLPSMLEMFPDEERLKILVKNQRRPS